MKRSLGRNWGRAAWTLTWLTTTITWCPGGGAMAQAPEQQHWPATPNNQSYPPNYQPSTVQAGPPMTGNPAAGQPSVGQPTAGQYQYPQQPDQPVGPPQYPGIERRPPASAGPSEYGNPPNDNRPVYPQDPRRPGVPGAPGGAIQGPPAAGPIQGPPVRPVAPQAPFVLAPQEAAALERLLTDWEKRNKEIRVMESKFYRWKYDAVFSNGQPPPPDEGELKFSAPDKGLMKIEAKDPTQSEQWLCDGKSIYQFDYKQHLVTEYVMPLEMQGKGIGDGPLPFVFGVEAEKLKQRYFMRIITPADVRNAVWLEAYPRYQQQAAEFSRVQVILQISGTTNALVPFAIQIYSPNGKDRVVYQLQDPKINPSHGIPDWFKSDWTKVSIPGGWKKKTELPPPPVEAGLSSSMSPRR